MHVKTHQGYIYWLFLYGMLAFEFKCPEEINRNLRIKEACSDKSPDHYSCLLDQQSNTYTESCTDPADFVRPGQKYVIGVFRKNIDCDTLRYQPFKFWSQQLSQCVFAKSRCNEAGQIMLNFGSTFGDSACRCDHTQGYAFVHNTKEHCYCIPSNEDCTCYKKLCPSSYILTSDYQCKPSLSEYSSCQDVKPVLHTILKTINKPLDAIDKKYFTSTEKSYTPKILCTIIILFLLVSVCLISKFVILGRPTKKSLCPESFLYPIHTSENRHLEVDNEATFPEGRHVRKDQNKDTTLRLSYSSINSANKDNGLPIDQTQILIENERQEGKIVEKECNALIDVDFELFMKKVGLDSFYPETLEISDVMKIYDKEKPQNLKGIAIMFIRNLVMLNYTCRDKLLEKYINKIQKYHTTVNREDQNDNNSNNVNPLDLIVAVFKCSSPMLKQILAAKLFMCKLAIPLVFPALGKDQMLVSIWPLRSLFLEWKTDERSFQHIAVDCPCQIVSFIRLGRPTISKSKLINEILTDRHHNTFVNKDCYLGTTKRFVSKGIIEVAWCLPSSESTVLKKVCMFLNLRGDSEIFTEQVTLMSNISSVVVIIMETNHLNNKNYEQLLQKFHKTNTGVILAIDVKNDSITSINQKLQTHSNIHLQLGKPFRYIILPSNGQDIAPINSEMRNRINELTQENEDVLLSERLNACSTDIDMIDEKKDYFSRTRQMAEGVIKLIPEKNVSQSVKQQAVPLQCEFSATWSRLNKDMNKASIEKSLEEDILQEMHQIRLDQLSICEHLGPFMRKFLNLLLESSTNECKMFILWLKHLLDERDLRYKLDNSECHLAEASFGLEHLCREMGQIYEVVSSCKTQDAKLEELKKQLPMITAQMLLLGLPFEIMDGDTANVPITWVKAVLMSLKDIIGDKKVLTISVLGIQGSGKSTLLNTMFGLQFDVSPRRCTRGVFMQLVPVDDNFPFERVLVIYAEGLRALELGHHEYKQSNELATFVIGLGDITVVNIKGEYTNEVNYVLQISVHAFLRLKFTYDSLSEQKRCVFVHQNVPAIDANDKVQGRKKFVGILDDITKKAVDKQNIAEINSFKDVIEFDREKIVWNFSDLWLGDHPMCYANPQYSQNVAKFRNAIMLDLPKKRKTYLTVTGTITRIENLWYRVLNNDFVFKFQS